MQFDEYEIPEENASVVNWETLSDWQKIQTTAKSRRLSPNQIEYFVAVFLTQNISSYNPVYYKPLAECMRKLIKEIPSPNQKTRILVGIIKFLQQNAVTDIHVAFLEACVESYNYKLGFQFVTQTTHFYMVSDNKSVYSEYYYFAGLICQAQREFDEALRYYRIASSFSSHSSYKLEAAKMEMLLLFRLGQSLRNPQDQSNQAIYTSLHQSLNQNSQQQEKANQIYDRDYNLCKQESGDDAILFQQLEREREIHLKVTFDQLTVLFNGNDTIQLDISISKLIEMLIRINTIHNMFWINEEQKLIEFKTNNLDYREINRKLEKRFDLVNQMLNNK